MRFAGQRFRSQSGSIGKYRQGRYEAESGRSAYSNPTGVGAMTQMRDINVQQMAKTSQPDMSNSPFSIGNFQEPEFRHPRRV